MKRTKKCPKCGSTRISINEYSEFYCLRCGFLDKRRIPKLEDFEKIGK